MENLELTMKVSDYISKRLAYLGLDTVFTVTGGGAMHLNDSFGSNESFKKIYNHHEQASAMGAEGYARVAGKPAIVCVTTGPGAINALNGVFGAYTDSIPMVVVAGQVKTETISTQYPDLAGIRQLGDQELKSMHMVAPITKFAVQLTSTVQVVESIDRAFLAAVTGRPGPVWIEVPVDVQAAELIADPTGPLPTLDSVSLDVQAKTAIAEITASLRGAKRPVIIAGTGVRISETQTELLALAELTSCPVVTAWTHDIFDNEHPLFAGRPGTIGTRPGNFVVQNADYVLVLGSRLNIRQVSYAWENFAADASVDWVDIDALELSKPFPSVSRKIVADLREFLPELVVASKSDSRPVVEERGKWLDWVREVNGKYSPKRADYESRQSGINPYHFIFELFDHKRETDVFVLGNATACILPYQVGKLGPKNRMISNSGSASMGFDLPAAIGAASVNGSERRTICLAGDGSVMMNVQELATLKSLDANIALIILDNGGYLSIKQTQTNFFKRENGASEESGVAFPRFVDVASAFGLDSEEISIESDWETQLELFLSKDGPRVLVVKLDHEQEFEPRLKSRMVDGKIQTPALDDMYPHLEDAELDFVRTSAKK
jgi:acetolactate synthase I/II/III large subunit